MQRQDGGVPCQAMTIPRALLHLRHEHLTRDVDFPALRALEAAGE